MNWSDFYESIKNYWVVLSTELYNRDMLMYSENSIYRR